MNIVVCCKAVPGLVTDLKIAADGKTIQYQGQLLAINECDEYALEEALALKRSHGGQITAISMGNIKALEFCITRWRKALIRPFASTAKAKTRRLRAPS